MKLKLLIVEDDAALAELLVWHCENEGYDVRLTGDGEEALLLAEEQVPDAILLDWMIHHVPGIEVLRRLRRAESTASVPVLMLTARGEEDDRVRALKSGADDYITKPFSPRELLARIEAVIRRARPATGGIMLSFADLELDPTEHRVRRGGKSVSISPTEFRLLRYFLERPRRVHSRSQLVDAVWGMDSDIEVRTIDVHIRRLRKAIERPGAPDLIRTVRSAGYALDDED